MVNVSLLFDKINETSDGTCTTKNHMTHYLLKINSGCCHTFHIVNTLFKFVNYSLTVFNKFPVDFNLIPIS